MLRALFYAEFDNTLGPVVLFDAPRGSVSGPAPGAARAARAAAPHSHPPSGSGAPCLFDAVSDYSITGPSLSGHLVTVRAPAFGAVGAARRLRHQLGHQGRGGQVTGQGGVGAGCGEVCYAGHVAGDVQVVNFPLAVSSAEAGRAYHRNALLFNVGLVLAPGAPAEVFAACLRKLALTLRAMELETAFLSNPTTKVSMHS